PAWVFDLRQIALAIFTLILFGILLFIVGEGLLGDPEMFILGNGSYPWSLEWFQPRGEDMLPQPWIVSVSVWYFRLLMLCWALWLAAALLRWLRWGWTQYTTGQGWKRRPAKTPSVTD
ncbi:MAG: hypothetical protein KDA61_16080, partial [Planctomycetales bacterium]|nr:hypothetical protein [Planctomycetales bacterium]